MRPCPGETDVIKRWLALSTIVAATACQGDPVQLPPPPADALLRTALALCWDPAQAPYEPFTLVNQAVEAAKQQRATAGQASFINACLRRFLRERGALLQHLRGNLEAQFNHPLWWVRQVQELPAIVVDPEQPKRSAWDLFKLPLFRRMLWINWVMASCWDVHTFVVPLMGHEQNLSASAIGSILGGFAIAAALIRVALPSLVHRVQEWQMISGSMVITCVLLVLYPLSQGAWMMGVCSVFLGFSLGVIQPMLMSMLHQITPHERHGEAIGLRLMAINASSVAMPMLFGVAGAFLGSAGVFWSVAAWVGVSTRTALRLKVDSP